MVELHKITLYGNTKIADFFYYAQIHANRNQVNGFIQNGIPNRLYLEVEGKPQQIEKFEKDFLNGFLAQHIDTVQIEKDTASGYFQFEVRRPVENIIEKKPFGNPLRFVAQFLLS